MSGCRFISVWLSIVALIGLCLMIQTGCDRWVFVTESAHTGDLGGLEGADAICQAEAVEAGLLGTYIAWISTTDVGPADRFAHPPASNYMLVDGTIIATNWDDLTDGRLLHGIDLTATGVLTWEGVWTNTKFHDGSPYNIYGNPAEDSCNEWTSASGNHLGAFGSSYNSGPEWTQVGFTPNVQCSNLLHFYCFLDQF